MLFLLVTLIHVISLGLVVTLAVTSAKDITAYVRTKQMSKYSPELVKKYATIFGLDNETITDVDALIEMGRKYEDFLGSEVIDDIVKQHHSFYSSYTVVTVRQRVNARRHHVNQVIKEHSIINRITCLQHTIFTQLITGGNKDGESNSSLY
jgi:hypothetical protein